MSAIRAETDVPAGRGEVFEFLAKLENHWELADRWIEVVSLDSDGEEEAMNGGAVRVRGPLGLSRIVRTRVVGIEPPERIHGFADVGRSTRAAIVWSLSPLPPESGVAHTERTRVRLDATIDALEPLDAVLWTLGGRTWMCRRLDAVLAGLARRFALPAPADAPA